MAFTSTRLKSGQISPLGLAALAIGIMSPALGLFALWGPMEAATGPIVPLVFIASAALALPTALSYAYLNKEAPSAGAASTWLWRAISPASGYLAGLTMTAYFIFAAIAQPLLFGIFFQNLLALFGIAVDGIWILILAVPLVTVPVMWLAYRGAQASTRFTVALMTVESAVVVLLSLTIIYTQSSIPGGVSLQPFNPMAATEGFKGFWTAMLLGILAFSGFDVVSTAAEETHAPSEYLPKVILLTIVGIALFWALNAWAFTLGMPHELVVQYAEHGDTVAAPLAARFWGWGKAFVILSAISGIFAVYVASALGASRIMFAMARHGLLPNPLARLDADSRVPKVALHALFAMVFAGDIIAIFTLRNGLAAFTWWAIATSRYKVLPNLLIPLSGATLTLYVMYQAFFVTLWNNGFETGRSVVYFCLVLLASLVALVSIIGRWWPKHLHGPAPLEAQEGESPEVIVET